MKKFTVILLIAVLAMTSVFADVDVTLSGSATAKYVVDFDANTFKYTAPTAAGIKAVFAFSSPNKTVAATDKLSAEVAADLKFTVANKTAGAFTTAHNLGEVGTFKLALSTFNVKYAAWTLNLLKAEAVGNFAKSAIDFAKEPNSTSDGYDSFAYDDKYAFTTKNGTTFSWKGYKFAAAVDGGYGKNGTIKEDIYVGVQTRKFTMGEFDLTGAGAFNYTGSANGYDATTGKAHNDQWLIAASLKAGFTADYMQIKVNTDHAITCGEKPATAYKAGKKAAYAVDAQLAATFGQKFATVDAYYGRKVAAYNDDDTPLLLNAFENLLSAKVAFNFNCFNAPIEAYVAGLNLINDAKILSTEFKFTLAEKYVMKAFGLDLLGHKHYERDFGTVATDKDLAAQKKYYADNAEYQKLGVATELTFGPVVVDGEVYTRIATEKVGFGVGAVYKNKWFKATADVDAEFSANESVKRGAMFKVAAGVESTTVIENATVSLKYASKNLLDAASYSVYDVDTLAADQVVKNGKGALTALLKVTF